jgi:hypothetical protein
MTIEQCLQFLDDTKSMIQQLAAKSGISPDEVFAKDSLETSTISGEDLEGLGEQSA